jgi:hypothetical protein
MRNALARQSASAFRIAKLIDGSKKRSHHRFQ